jgi:hypothetical protein
LWNCVSPSIVSYNANDVKIYNATSIQVLFENKNIFLLEKCFRLLHTYNALYSWKSQSRRIGSCIHKYWQILRLGRKKNKWEKSIPN